MKRAIIQCLKYVLRLVRGSETVETKIIFIVLNSAIKQRVVCDIAEKCYLTKKSAVINLESIDEGNKLDNLIWTWKQSSFVPHNYVEELTQKYQEPITITSSLKNNPGNDILIMSDPVPLSTISHFLLVIDFAEKYDLTLLEKSRERYKIYKDQKLEIQTVQPGEFLHLDLNKMM